MTVQMLLEQSRTFYFLLWNKSNIKEIKTTLHYACQINIRIFPTEWATCPHTKVIKLRLLVWFLDEIIRLKNKFCVIKKMPVPALRFAYSHFYNNHVKIVSTSTRQTKLKKILIKQKHAIQVIFHVNDETRPSPSTFSSVFSS